MEIDREDYLSDDVERVDMLIPAIGTLERIFLERAIEIDDNGNGRGVTFLDFVGTGITEENIDQVVNNLRNGMFVAENEETTKVDS